jgi:hypothetical protein
MKLAIFLMILSVVLVSCCTTTEVNIDFSNLKPALNYSWKFNENLTDEYGGPTGGYTYNSTYLELKKYNNSEESEMKHFGQWDWSLLNCKFIPYTINFKHEEGHILTLQLLKIENLNNFLNYRYNNSNLSNIFNTFNDSLVYFGVPVSEGIADYYAISYFNNSTSDDYLKCIKIGKEIDYRYKQHYQGFTFVQYALENKLYSNFTDLILDMGSVRQYNYYLSFENRFNGNP